MSNPTLQEILKAARWGDYQKEDGTWAIGIANQPELIQAISAAMDSIIGEDEVITQRYSGGLFVNGKQSFWRDKQALEEFIRPKNELRAEQRKRKDTFLGGGNG